MFPLGMGVLLFGIWLVESGYKNRTPIQTLTAIFADPKTARATLANSRNTGLQAAAAPGFDNSAGGSGDWGGASSANGSGAAAVAIAYARSQIGKPYVWGGTGPNGWDCSGLTQAAYGAAGVRLPRVTQQQVFSGTAVTRANLAPGDLVFPDPGHVGIYTGGGMFVEAPHTGLNVREIPVYGVWRARRIISKAPVSATVDSRIMAGM